MNLQEFISLAVVKTDVNIVIQNKIQYQIISFLLLIFKFIISAAFYGGRGSKMGHSIFWSIFKKNILELL